MKRVLIVITLIAAVALLIGCGPKPMQSTSVKGQPAWYSKPPTKPNYIYGVFTAVSQDMQLAIDKAAAGARTEIGRQVEVQIHSLQKRFDEETGFGSDAQLLQQFADATKLIVNAKLEGTIVKDQVTRKDGDFWRAYVLMEYPIGEAHAALVKELRKNDVLLTRIRASEAFKDLEKEIDKQTTPIK